MSKKIIILTAVDQEYITMENIFEKTFQKTNEEIDGGNRYTVFSNSDEYTIYLSKTGQGNSEAATRTTHAIKTLEPDLLIFVGTCGAIKDVKIGDIIIADRVYDYHRGKETDNGFVSKPKSWVINAEIRSICGSYVEEFNKANCSNADSKSSRACIGTIGSGEAIISGKHTHNKDIIDNHYGDIIAVEMEGFGVCTAAYETNFHNTVVVRAVTDDSIDKTAELDGINQPLVMKKIAHFVYEFIEHYFNTKQGINVTQNITQKQLKSSKIILYYQDKKFIPPDETIFCVFLSFKLQNDMCSRFHLGHCYFIYVLETLIKTYNASIFLCASFQSISNLDKKKLKNYNHSKQELIQKWSSCFEEKINIIDIDNSLNNENIEIADFVKEFSFTYNKIARKISKLSNDGNRYANILDELINWRIKGGNISENNLGIIKDCLDIQHQEHFSDIEILSMAYTMFVRPSWLRQEWFTDFLVFWEHSTRTLMGKIFGRVISDDNMCIMESKRNAYVWNATSFCLQKNKIKFPKIILFDNVPDITMKKYMKSSDKDTAIFIKDYDELPENTNLDFIKRIAEMFDMEGARDDQLIKGIIDQYKFKLGLK
jgi:nucleoside phosphorylase